MKQSLHIVLTVELHADYEIPEGKPLPEFKTELKNLILEDPDLLLESSGAMIFCTVTNGGK